MSETPLILASSSPFRQQLLSRLQIPFETQSPDIDETILPSESARDHVLRLSRLKAAEIASQHPDAIIIGSDQCAFLNDRILGKPGDHEHARQQLTEASGQEVVFYTGLCVMQESSGFCEQDCAEYRVGFRSLSDAQIEHYLQVEQPYQCAGSFKSEGYGISLFSHMTGDDPTSIIGLPLIRLVGMLESAGIRVV